MCIFLVFISNGFILQVITKSMFITFFLLQSLQSAIVSKPISPGAGKTLLLKATPPTAQLAPVADRNFGALPPMTADNDANGARFLNELTNSGGVHHGEIDPVEYDLKIAKELAMENRQQLMPAAGGRRFSFKPNDGSAPGLNSEDDNSEVHERKLYAAEDDRRPAAAELAGAEGGIFHGVLVFLGYCLLFLIFVAFLIGLTAFFKHETKPKKKKKGKSKKKRGSSSGGGLDDGDTLSTKEDSISEKDEVSHKHKNTHNHSSINGAGNEGEGEGGSSKQHSPNSFFVPLPDDDEQRGERYRQRRKIRRAQRRRRRELKKKQKMMKGRRRKHKARKAKKSRYRNSPLPQFINRFLGSEEEEEDKDEEASECVQCGDDNSDEGENEGQQASQAKSRHLSSPAVNRMEKSIHPEPLPQPGLLQQQPQQPKETVYYVFKSTIADLERQQAQVLNETVASQLPQQHQFQAKQVKVKQQQQRPIAAQEGKTAAVTPSTQHSTNSQPVSPPSPESTVLYQASSLKDNSAIAAEPEPVQNSCCPSIAPKGVLDAIVRQTVKAKESTSKAHPTKPILRKRSLQESKSSSWLSSPSGKAESSQSSNSKSNSNSSSSANNSNTRTLKRVNFSRKMQVRYIKSK